MSSFLNGSPRLEAVEAEEAGAAVAAGEGESDHANPLRRSRGTRPTRGHTRQEIKICCVFPCRAR